MPKVNVIAQDNISPSTLPDQQLRVSSEQPGTGRFDRDSVLVGRTRRRRVAGGNRVSKMRVDVRERGRGSRRFAESVQE